MKAARILLAGSIACLLMTARVPAQGRINFSNTSLTPLRIGASFINGGVPVVLGTASTALFGFGPASAQLRLYAGLTSSSLQPVLIGTALPPNQEFVLNTSSVIAAAQGTFDGGHNLPLWGFDGSAPVFLQFTGVSIDGTEHGLSPIIQVNLATGVAPSTTVFSPTADASHWNGLTLYRLSPEPSALALTGSSFAVMFFARRKIR